MTPLCSELRSLVISERPSKFQPEGINLGTRKRDIPLVPLGASGVFASTRWTIFSVISCSPYVMNILVPVRWYDPSFCGTALVDIIPKSVPACGSVRHIVPDHFPEAIFLAK